MACTYSSSTEEETEEENKEEEDDGNAFFHSRSMHSISSSRGSTLPCYDSDQDIDESWILRSNTADRWRRSKSTATTVPGLTGSNAVIDVALDFEDLWNKSILLSTSAAAGGGGGGGDAECWPQAKVMPFLSWPQIALQFARTYRSELVRAGFQMFFLKVFYLFYCYD